MTVVIGKGETRVDEMTVARLFDELQQRGVMFVFGLASAEVAVVEDTYGFHFPPDLKAFLQYALPVAPGFPNWRDGPEADLRAKIDWPLDGMLFDIAHNAFWLDEWGRRPNQLEDGCVIARREVARAPVLIPVYGHRYLPAEPYLPGNPVLSVYQTDIIVYGNDLAAYFRHEFGINQPICTPTRPRTIRF